MEKKGDLILGLDISTSCIGISIVYDDGENMPVVREIRHVVPKIPSKKKGIEALILRKEIFERDFLTKIKDYGITECVIEAPLKYASSMSNANTVAQLLQFNGLLSEAVYRVLGIVPKYITSYDARKLSFPELMSVRKFNKKGELYPIKHIEKSLKESHLILFGSYPFDCDKKNIMMNVVCEKYPEINWIRDANGEIRKENFDACDSLVCVLAHVNVKRHGESDAKVTKYSITDGGDVYNVEYTVTTWGVDCEKKMTVPKTAEKKA